MIDLEFIPDTREPVIKGDFCYILLACGKIAFTDASDYELIKSLNKKFHIKRGKKSEIGYASFKLTGNNKKSIMLHDILMEPSEGYVVDHINGNSLDNTRKNLRLATQTQNHWNSQSYGLSVYKGVCYEKDRRKWKTQIRFNGKTVFKKRYNTEIEAAIAYNENVVKFQGEFSKLNIIEVL